MGHDCICDKAWCGDLIDGMDESGDLDQDRRCARDDESEIERVDQWWTLKVEVEKCFKSCTSAKTHTSKKIPRAILVYVFTLMYTFMHYLAWRVNGKVQLASHKIYIQ